MATFDKIVKLLDIKNIISRLSQIEKEEIIAKLNELEDVYPFSDYEFIISNLL
jgi:hypothetical protein